MEQPSKRAQFVPGMRAYSAHNCLHVNAPSPCRFAHSYIIGSTCLEDHPGDEPRRFLRERIGPSARAARTPLGGADCDAQRRTRPLSRSATPVPSLARDPTSKTELGEEAGAQFVPSMRANGAHNRLHVNAPVPGRFELSYMIHHPSEVRIQSYGEGSSMISKARWWRSSMVRQLAHASSWLAIG
jgi:hypothetical protein